MKKTHTPITSLPLLTADTCAFGENTPLTLMSCDALDEELWLLQTACAPTPDDPVTPIPLDRPLFQDIRYKAPDVLMTLPRSAPKTPDVVRQKLAHLPLSERLLLHDLAETAQDHLSACRRSAPMCLVPMGWNYRMTLTLAGHLYPARVRHSDIDRLFDR